MSSESEYLKGSDYNMNLEKNRLESFKNWPFELDCNCTPEKLAGSGFYYCPTDREPDLVRCYVCFKELDGWEPEDDPWKEHCSHSKKCLFVKLNKREVDLTVEDFLKLECQRQINRIKKIVCEKCEEFKSEAEKCRQKIQDLV
ncbi:baculoviral IAP repeat containing deterin [Tachypleus tridentatus]|uniref:baculoviral IAP repeat containing deterin n=1 Tax=Tachypleus tridentatus TaxID=6853 RepID=UPI003FD3E2F6